MSEIRQRKSPADAGPQRVLRVRELLLYERKKTHVASALDRGFNGTLLFGSESRALATNDATVGIYKLFQQLDVFVVDVADVVLRKNIVRHSDPPVIP